MRNDRLAGSWCRPRSRPCHDGRRTAPIGSHLSPTRSTCNAIDGPAHRRTAGARNQRGQCRGREPWLVVDPVLLRGDIAYDLARALWTRLDEIADAAGIVGCFDIAVRESGVDRDQARDAVVFRAVDYWLWCLAAGLTEDPLRCERLIRAFV